MGRRSKRVEEEQVRKPGIVSLFAIAASGCLGLAICYNALFAQSGSASLAAGDLPQGATTHMEVSAQDAQANTIQLKYDPMIEDVQRELLAAGFYRGTVDGVVGRKTRDAILSYQKANKLDPNGLPSQALVDHIRYTRQLAEATLFTGSVEPAPDAEQRARVRRVQTTLSDLAYLQDGISGEMDASTQTAIRQFEHDHGMAETGVITDALLKQLTMVSGQPSITPQQ